MNISSEYRTIIRVIVIVIALLIGFTFLYPYLSFSLTRYLSGKTVLEDLNQPQDLSSNRFYGDYSDLGNDGMILERDAGEENINQVLTQKKRVIGCEGCSVCAQAPNVQFYNCSICNSCVGITEANRFNKCVSCTSLTGFVNENCSSCIDTKSEYDICDEIKKKCIFEYTANPLETENTGCKIKEIERNDSAIFDLNTFKNVLQSCYSESLVIDVGNTMERELCFFNNTSISYYSLPASSDFYFSEKFQSGPYPPVAVGSADVFMYYDNKGFPPFYKINGESFQKYRIYVALEDVFTGTRYKIFVGHYHHLIFDWTDYECELGTMVADSNNFSSAEFIDFSSCSLDWKNDPGNRTLNGIRVERIDNSFIGMIYLGFYSNHPESKGVFYKGLRYPRCNFMNDPEPYLEDRPWWADFNPDNINTSWTLVGGNPNSSIKVFYYPSMSGGELSSAKRGNVKLSLGRLDTNFQKDCKFDIYICPQDSFAEYEDENILILKNFFENFNPTNVYKTVKDGNNNLIIYNYFELPLDKNYTTDEIESVIKTGFRLWEQNNFILTSYATGLDWLSNGNNEGIYENVWTSTYGPSKKILFDNECWSSNVLDILKRRYKRNILGNCPDNTCRDKLRVRIAFKYTPPSRYSPWKNPLYPIITYCGYNETASVCGNGKVEGLEECDGSNLGGQTCQSLGYSGGGTLSCTVTCTFNKINCVGYMDYFFQNTGTATGSAGGCGDKDFYDANKGWCVMAKENGEYLCFKGTVDNDVSADRLWCGVSNNGNRNSLIFNNYGNANDGIPRYLECASLNGAKTMAMAESYLYAEPGVVDLIWQNTTYGPVGPRNPPIFDNMKNGWCTDPTDGLVKNCLLCGEDGNFYVCRGKPFGIPGYVPFSGVIERRPWPLDPPTTFTNYLDNTVVFSCKCNISGDWSCST